MYGQFTAAEIMLIKLKYLLHHSLIPTLWNIMLKNQNSFNAMICKKSNILIYILFN